MIIATFPYPVGLCLVLAGIAGSYCRRRHRDRLVAFPRAGDTAGRKAPDAPDDDTDVEPDRHAAVG